MYFGRIATNSLDTYRFLNINTNKVLVSQDVIYSNQIYGEFSGDKRLYDMVSVKSKPDILLPVIMTIKRI